MTRRNNFPGLTPAPGCGYTCAALHGVLAV